MCSPKRKPGRATGRSSCVDDPPLSASNSAHRKDSANDSHRPRTDSPRKPRGRRAPTPIHHSVARGDDAVVHRTPAVTVGGSVRAIRLDEDRRDVGSSLWSWTTLMDGVLLLGVVCSVPIAVLIVGTPVALAIAFLLWLVRLALHAF
jgi:hypothetical protein